MKNTLFFLALATSMMLVATPTFAQLKPLRTVKLDAAKVKQFKALSSKVSCTLFKTKAEYKPYFDHVASLPLNCLGATVTLLESKPGTRTTWTSTDDSGFDEILVFQSDINCNGFKTLLTLHNGNTHEPAEITFDGNFGRLTLKRNNGTSVSFMLTSIGNGMFQGTATSGTTISTVILTFQRARLDLEAGISFLD